MKLQHSEKYAPLPFVLTTKNVLYHVPLPFCLLHSVEEIEAKIDLRQDPKYFAQLQKYQKHLCQQLHVDVSVGQ